MKTFALLAAAAILTIGVAPAPAAEEQTTETQFQAVVDELLVAKDRYRRLTPEEALAQMKKGNARFVEEKSIRRPLTTIERQALAAEQHPFVSVLGCADSRVPVEVVFDRLPGDVFTVRVAGNVASPEIVGSLEFSVAKLKVPLIVVLGHQQCGAVAAALAEKETQAKLPGSLNAFVQRINPAVEAGDRKRPLNEVFEKAKIANIKLQVETLKKSPVLADAVKEGKLKIVGAYFTIDDGSVKFVE